MENVSCDQPGGWYIHQFACRRQEVSNGSILGAGGFVLGWHTGTQGHKGELNKEIANNRMYNSIIYNESKARWEGKFLWVNGYKI